MLPLKISATGFKGMFPHLFPPYPPSHYFKKKVWNCPFRALASLALDCLDLPKPRPFLISILSPQWKMRSPWCEMSWQYHDLASHKTTTFKTKFWNLIVYPGGYVIQSNDHEAICKILTFSWMKYELGDGLWWCGGKNIWQLGEASKAQMIQGVDQFSWFL